MGHHHHHRFTFIPIQNLDDYLNTKLDQAKKIGNFNVE